MATKSVSRSKARNDHKSSEENLFRQFKKAPAKLTQEEVCAINEWLVDAMPSLRMALAMLSMTPAHLIQKVNEHRDVAVAIEDCSSFARTASGRFGELAELLKCADVWCLMSLVERNDFEDIIAEGKQARAA